MEKRLSELKGLDIAFNPEGKTYLCKVCQSDYTYNEDGICDNCKERIEENKENKILSGMSKEETDNFIKESEYNSFDDYMKMIEEEYYKLDNIEIINDGDNNYNERAAYERMLNYKSETEDIEHFLKKIVCNREIEGLNKILEELKEIDKKVNKYKNTYCDACVVKRCAYCRISNLYNMSLENYINKIERAMVVLEG